MKHIGVFFIISIVAVVIVGCGPTKHLDDKIDWKKFDAVAANFPGPPHPGAKPIFLYFKQTNCHYCTEMDSLFARPEVAWYINENFLPVSVNVDTDLPLHTGGEIVTYERLFQIFKMDGFPSYYFFDSTGRVMGMMERSMSLLTLKQMLMYIRNGYFGKINFDAFLNTEGVPKDTVLGVF